MACPRYGSRTRIWEIYGVSDHKILEPEISHRLAVLFGENHLFCLNFSTEGFLGDVSVLSNKSQVTEAGPPNRSVSVCHDFRPTVTIRQLDLLKVPPSG